MNQLKAGDVLAAEDEIDLHAIIALLAQRQWVIISTIVFFLFLGALYSFSATRIYQADALMQVETDAKSADAILGNMSDLFDSKAVMTGEIELVKSRMIIGQVVDKLGLTIKASPRYFPVIGRALSRIYVPSNSQPLASAWPGLSKFAWGGEQIKITRLEVPDALQNKILTLISGDDGNYKLFAPDGIQLLDGKVGAPARDTSGEIKVFVQSLISRPGTHFLVESSNRGDEINEINKNLTAVEKGKQSGIMSLTYSGADPDLVRVTLQNIAIAYQRQNVERKSAEAQASLTFLEGQLPELRAKLERSEDELNSYRLKVGSIDLTQETQIALQNSVQLEQEKLDLQQKRRELMQRFTPDHPALKTLDAQMDNINTQLAKINGQAKNLPETQQELLRLTRDVTVNTDLYTNLLNNSQQLQVMRAGTVGNVRIIDSPERPLIPTKPKISLVMTLCFFMGIFAGIGLAYLLNALHSGEYDPAKIEAALGIPTYASVPYTRGQDQIDKDMHTGQNSFTLLASSHPQDLAIEALRNLRTALHFAQIDAINNVLMLTGPTPGLGKSFISLNLAATLAASDKKIVVVDADMRRGHMHESINVPRYPGLSDVIAGDASLDQALIKTPVEGMFFLATGTIPPNPSELLLKEQFVELVKELSRRFDTVIIDTPPVLAVTDASIVGRLAGTTLLVMKSGEHPMRMIQDTYRRLSNAGVTVRGTVLNMISTGSGRYGYGPYGYRYGYYRYDYKSHA